MREGGFLGGGGSPLTASTHAPQFQSNPPQRWCVLVGPQPSPDDTSFLVSRLLVSGLSGSFPLCHRPVSAPLFCLSMYPCSSIHGLFFCLSLIAGKRKEVWEGRPTRESATGECVWAGRWSLFPFFLFTLFNRLFWWFAKTLFPLYPRYPLLSLTQALKTTYPRASPVSLKPPSDPRLSLSGIPRSLSSSFFPHLPYHGTSFLFVFLFSCCVPTCFIIFSSSLPASLLPSFGYLELFFGTHSCPSLYISLAAPASFAPRSLLSPFLLFPCIIYIHTLAPSLLPVYIYLSSPSTERATDLSTSILPALRQCTISFQHLCDSHPDSSSSPRSRLPSTPYRHTSRRPFTTSTRTLNTRPTIFWPTPHPVYYKLSPKTIIHRLHFVQ